MHRRNLPSLGYNSLGDSYKDKRGDIAQPNIFRSFATSKKNTLTERATAKARLREGTVFVNNKGQTNASPLGAVPQNKLATRRTDADPTMINKLS